MERSGDDQAGVELAGDQQLEQRTLSPQLLSCAVCCVSLGELVCELDRVPGSEDTPAYGLEDLDGTGLDCWLICDECLRLAFRPADIDRGADGCLEPGGDWVSRDGYVWPATPEVDQPADVVAADSDSDGCGRAGGCGCLTLGPNGAVSGDTTAATAKG
jgi:hypothetical protein